MIDISCYESVLKDLSIPPRPQVVAALFEEMSRDTPDLNRVSKTIASDPGMAGGILKVANSPLLGLARKATTVAQAVNLLGLRQTSAIATGIAIRHSLGGNSSPAMEKFWNDTERVALIGSYLSRSEQEAAIGSHVARALRGLRTDEAYTYALFHNCGIPVLLQRFPRYLETLKKATTAGAAFRAVEETEVGTHHGAVGYYLARSWGLAQDLCDAIYSHHDINAMDDAGGLSRGSRNFVGVGILSEYVYGASHRGVVDAEWDIYREAVMRHFGLDDDGIVDLVDTVEAALNREAETQK